MSQSNIPDVGERTQLDSQIKAFLEEHKLQLGGQTHDFHAERRHHLEIFGFHALSSKSTAKEAPIGRVEFSAIRGPHGTIPLRLFYPQSAESRKGKLGSLIYFHGGGYTVGSIDEFEQGLRIIAEASDLVVVGVEYRLAPEHKAFTQLDEYEAVLEALKGDFGKQRGLDSSLVAGGGDSAGGNMTAAITLRRADAQKPNLKAQILYYPEARVPFDTQSNAENNTGLYLEANGIFSFADHYVASSGIPPSHRYISPGMQPIEKLKGLPPAAVFTCGFDPLRDVGVQYAKKLQEAGNTVEWRHYPTSTHGFVQLTPWSNMALQATKETGRLAKQLVYGE